MKENRIRNVEGVWEFAYISPFPVIGHFVPRPRISLDFCESSFLLLCHLDNTFTLFSSLFSAHYTWKNSDISSHTDLPFSHSKTHFTPIARSREYFSVVISKPNSISPCVLKDFTSKLLPVLAYLFCLILSSWKHVHLFMFIFHLYLLIFCRNSVSVK